MRQDVTFGVLRELGVLFQAPGVGAEDTSMPVPPGADHDFFAHTPLWDYEDPAYARPSADPQAKPVYQTLPPGTGVEAALAHTRLIVFLGAGDTPALRRALAEPGTLLLVFEHDPGRVARLAQALGPARLAGRIYIFLGEAGVFVPPLGMVLPADLFQAGFPVFYALPDLAAARPDFAVETVRLLEALFFRYLVYPLSGQSNSRGLPLRPMVRGLFFDQQLHSYANVHDWVTRPDIGILRRSFQGETAILVAAGPDLDGRLDSLRRQCDNAVIISVNTALKPLLNAGVRPHFVVANDTSLGAGLTWRGLPRLDDVWLVSHCLSDLAGDTFAHKFLFGSYRPELFGARPSLRLHGSVITTAYSLARHLGCARCVLVGVQLCSENPWAMSYSRGTIHENHTAPPRPLTGAFPQLVPVTNRFGLTRYTTPNFLDASLWLLDEIRSTGLACVNVTRESLVHGPGVAYDPDFAAAPSPTLARRLRQVPGLKARPRPLGSIRRALGAELAFWRAIEAACARMNAASGPAFLDAAGQLLGQFDQNNVSYLVQRFEDFDNPSFHRAVFDSAGVPAREAGFQYYFGYVGRMAKVLAGVLEEQIAALSKR